MSVPSTDDLRSFLLGTLPPAEAERVSTWVHDTPPAADALRQALAADAVTEVLSDTARRTPLPADRVEQVVRSVMQSLRPAPGTSKPVAVIPEEVGDFRVRRELGRGGMGVVLEAEDGLLHRLVAIKLIAAESAGEPGSRERFLREARSAAAIQHENVVPVHQVGDASGLLFIVMPLLQGETLDARLRREGRLPPAEAARVAREVAAGLAAAHERGLIHRDIKPSNIWLEEKTGRVKILDFGLARLAAEDGPEPLTQRGALVGTPAYMSPEQARGESLDARTDLFSLGVVLYQMLTGRLPFTAGNTTGLLLAVTTATPPRPCDLNPEAPADLDQLVMHLLMKDRAARPASAAAVGDALVRIETSLNQTMRMSERPETLPKPSPAPLRSRGRRVAPWAVAATTFLAFVATLGVIIIKIKHKDGTETTITVPDGTGLVVEQEGKTLARIEPKAAGPRVDPAAFAAGHSPLDKLDPNQIPKEERFPWQPKELVAVIGSHCQRSWGCGVRQLLLGQGPHLHGPPPVPARGVGRRPRPPRGGRGAGGGDLPHQAANWPWRWWPTRCRGGAVPLGRRRQRLRRQPDVRAGGAAAGQVVRAGQLGRRPRLDRGAPGDPARAAAEAQAGRPTLHAAAGRRRGEAGRRGGRGLAGQWPGVG